ncbi:MAG TPA: tetratricopeptide repeat protein [Chthonomonadaceae bacterium]|nr:tetratricopeptide repeat protein [Chthonomonadaceae bacterium]
MTPARRSAGGGSKSTHMRPLLVALVAIVLLYVALLPQLRRMQAETERLRREEARHNAALTQPARPGSDLDAARAAVAKAPDDLNANMVLASDLVAAGKPDVALGYVRRCANRAPHDVRINLALADLYERLRRHYDAMQTYRALLAQDPGNLDAINRLCWLYISYGWTTDARALLEPVVRANPDDPHLAVELALTYLQTHDFQRSQQLLLKLRKEHPDELDLWLPLADLYRKQAQFPKAIGVLRDALKLRPGDPALMHSLADARFESDDISGAMSVWQTIVSAAPNDVPAHYGLAECYRKLGKTAEAVQELETVKRLAPGYQETKLMLGQLYLRTGHAIEGGKLLRAYQEEHARSRVFARVSLLLASKPRDPAVHFEMAGIYVSGGNTERAIVELHRALDLNPHYDSARKMLAHLEQPRS